LLTDQLVSHFAGQSLGLFVDKKLMRKIRTFSRNKELVELRRTEIAMVAAEVFSRKGYGSATIRDISDRLQVSSALIYYYIGKKSDIVALMVNVGERDWGGFFEKIEADLKKSSATEVLCNTITDYLVRNDKFRHWMRFWYSEIRHASPEIRKLILDWNAKVVDSFEKILVEGYTRGEFSNYFARSLSHMIVSYGESWALKPWLLRRHFTLEEYIEALIQITLKSLAVDEKAAKVG